MCLGHRLYLLTILACVGVGCDQATKCLAVFALKDLSAHSFLYNTIRLEYAENTGAFLSLGSGLPDGARFFWLTIVSGCILLALTFFVCFQRNLRGLDCLGYALILAGGLSNLLDRILAGYVVDFLNLGIGSLRTGVFNVADVVIMVGLVIVTVVQFKSIGAPVDRQVTS